MSADLLALLDELDAAREKATPGEWGTPEPREDGTANLDALTRADGFRRYTRIGKTLKAADAGCIVAEHNAAPKLTAALRVVLTVVDEWENTGSRLGRSTLSRALVVRVLRAEIAAALTPEQVDR